MKQTVVETVSVVISAYDAEEFLARAVRSALEQTYPVLEVVIVDDGSSDGTSDLAKSLGREDDRVKLIAFAENGGPSKARNAGFAAAKGEWIAVLDADDAYLPERIANMIAVGEGADIVADNFRYYDARRGSIGAAGASRTEGFATIDILSFADARRDHEDFGLFQPMFRRRFLEKHRLRYCEDVRHGEDFLLAFEALAHGAVYRLIWTPGYLYTTRASGWSRTSIDYAGLSERLSALAGNPTVAIPLDVRAALADRAAYVGELQIQREAKQALKRKKLLKLAWLVIRHRAVRKMAAKKARQLRSAAKNA